MADLLLLLLTAAFLLLVLPQVVGIAVGALAGVTGRWWPVLAAIAAPAAVFALAAELAYSPHGPASLRATPWAQGEIVIDDPATGALAHAAAAAVIQIVRLVRGR